MPQSHQGKGAQKTMRAFRFWKTVPARRVLMGRALALAALCLCLGGCGSPASGQTPAPSASPGVERLSAAAEGAPGAMSIPQVAQMVSPSVVGIATESLGREGSVSGIGTGVVVHESGYVLTNHHVAGGVNTLMVIFQDGSRAPGKTLFSDPALDLAVVQIERGHPAAKLARSADVVVGETVVAIGTPLALSFQHTVTSGIVSAVNRTLQLPTDSGESYLENLIQTDASINPGNSGGPLLNLRGEIIGINTVKVTAAEGIGFAIPVDVAAPIIDRFAAEGAFVMPYLGVFAFDGAIAQYYDERITLDGGLMVINLAPGSPAEEAGVESGDVLLSADGADLNTMLDLRIALVKRRPGEAMQLLVRRGGKTFTAAPVLAQVRGAQP